MSSEALLEVHEVSKRFRVQGRDLHAVEKVSFQLQRGQTFGLVGESGSGKSTLGRLVLKLLEATEGRIVYQGKDITRFTQKQMRPLRQELQIIFQDPMASMSPRMTIGMAIEDAMIIHRMGTKEERQKRVDELLERVGLPREVKWAYPHELSGGQLQRVGIARALSLRPKLVICDEPISALDVSIQVQVIQLLRELQQDYDLTYIFISHNLAVVEYLSDVVAVLYLGEVVEQAPAEELFSRPTHPYTQVLIQSILKMPPSLEERQVLTPIQGEIPSPFDPPKGCPFHPRCPMSVDRCRTTKPERRLIGPNHAVACHLAT
ncbi:ABC transporter ATP-binding protein [Alicyclobacillus sendaiensis]|uniref:ABC transporter ATP-binding protein n=1 Tax=Alicyclobacillus sendaiensis TaxID=192387 RepID=UPI0026F468BD|nr:ABC transporter ATP-binding protein [Alicyclobacillus sendaiensis]